MRSSKQEQVQVICKKASKFILEEAKCHMKTRTGSGTDHGNNVLNLAKGHLLYTSAINCTGRWLWDLEMSSSKVNLKSPQGSLAAFLECYLGSYF